MMLTNRLSTAAYFNVSGPIPLARIEGSEAYQSYMRSTLSEKPKYHHNPTDAKAILTSTLEQIQTKARLESGKLLRIGTITYPPYMNMQLPPELFSAANELDPHFNDWIRVRHSNVAAAVTFPPSDCWDRYMHYDGSSSDDEKFILVFTQNFDTLSIQLGSIFYDCPICFNKWASLPWPSSQATIQAILEDKLQGYKPDEILAVFLSPEDAQTDLSPVKEAIQSGLYDSDSKIKVPSIGNEYVSAIGAACIALNYVLWPEVFIYAQGDYVGKHE